MEQSVVSRLRDEKVRAKNTSGPGSLKMVKLNPGLSQISSMVFSCNNMQLEVQNTSLYYEIEQ